MIGIQTQLIHLNPAFGGRFVKCAQPDRAFSARSYELQLQYLALNGFREGEPVLIISSSLADQLQGVIDLHCVRGHPLVVELDLPGVVRLELAIDGADAILRCGVFRLRDNPHQIPPGRYPYAQITPAACGGVHGELIDRLGRLQPMENRDRASSDPLLPSEGDIEQPRRVDLYREPVHISVIGVGSHDRLAGARAERRFRCVVRLGFPHGTSQHVELPFDRLRVGAIRRFRPKDMSPVGEPEKGDMTARGKFI